MRKAYIDYEVVCWLTDTLPCYQYVIRTTTGKALCAYDEEQEAIDHATKAGYGDIWDYTRPVLVAKA